MRHEQAESGACVPEHLGGNPLIQVRDPTRPEVPEAAPGVCRRGRLFCFGGAALTARDMILGELGSEDGRAEGRYQQLERGA